MASVAGAIHPFVPLARKMDGFASLAMTAGAGPWAGEVKAPMSLSNKSFLVPQAGRLFFKKEHSYLLFS
jgi:hypothetical protein